MGPDNCIVYEVQDCEWNWGQGFFFLLSFIPLATILPIWVVARFIWLPYVRKIQQETQNTESRQEIPYEYRFPPENAENDNVTVRSNSNFFIEVINSFILCVINVNLRIIFGYCLFTVCMTYYFYP